MATAPARVRPLSKLGVVALLVTKGGDLLTTVYGLLHVDGVVEANPVAAAVLAHAGIAGLVLMSVVGTLLVVLVVEWGANTVGRLTADDRTVGLLYAGGYLPLTCLYALATLNNVTVIVS